MRALRVASAGNSQALDLGVTSLPWRARALRLVSEHSAQGRGGARGLVARAGIHALVILAGLVARTVNVAVALGC